MDPNTPDEASNGSYMERLSKVECRDSTYQPSSDPLVFRSASGSVIKDCDGSQYLDFCAGFGVLAFGHNPPYIKNALAGPIPLMHAMGDVYPSEEKVLFLEALLRVLPDAFETAALSISGAGAVETALKSAMLKTGKAGFISFDHSYHGVDMGTLLVTSRNDFKDPFESSLKLENNISLPINCSADELEAAVSRLESTCGFAGIIAEPIQGRGGIVEAAPEFLRLLYKTTKDAGGLLIYDEIFCGLGRAGRITFSEEFPCDIICLGKALGGGMPISACVGTAEAMSGWPKSQGEAIHTGTFFGHPLSCYLGRLTIKKLLEDSIPARALRLGKKMREILNDALLPNEKVLEIRGQGMMTGIVFEKAGEAVRLFDAGRKEGLILLPSGPSGNVLSLTPALNISESDLKSGCLKVAGLL